jgi:2-phosphosulfolactate phosphatase
VHINYVTPETCSVATESAVVVDVWRSFTTAAYAFSAGAHDIIVVASTEEALALHLCYPMAVLMGMES